MERVNSAKDIIIFFQNKICTENRTKMFLSELLPDESDEYDF